MGKRGIFSAAFVLFLAKQGMAAEPTAKELAQARDLFAKAEQREQASHFEEALPLLEQAVRIKTTPGLLFHIGYAKEKLGRYKEALAAYEEAERVARAEKKEEVLAILKEQLPALREKLPSIEILGADVPFTMTIDQELPFPYANAPVDLDPGPHRIVLRGDGRRPYQRDISVRERERMHLDVKFEREAPATQPVAAPPPPAAAPSKGHGLAIATAVGAAVLVGAAVPFYLLGGSAKDDGQRCVPADCDAVRSKTRVYDWMSASLLVAGVASGVVSIVLFTSKSNDAPTTSAAGSKTQAKTSARVGVSTNGLFLSGTFE